VIDLEQARPSPLTRQSMSGAVWLLSQTLAWKSVTLASQVVLAYLLSPADFGYISLALAVTAFGSVLYQNGLAHVLVQRRDKMSGLADQAFWLSMIMAAGATLILVAVAPIAGLLFKAPEVRNLIWVLAAAPLVDAASVVPRARLIADLEFAKTARINGAQIILQSLLSVLFAWLGFSYWSFAVPVPLASLVALGLYCRHHSLQVHGPRRSNDWPSLTRDTAYLVGTTWLTVIVEQGDYFLLGLLVAPSAVGVYFFAFRLSSQSVRIVAMNIGRVLFPVLVRLPIGSRRQYLAFVRAVRALSGVGVPIAVAGAIYGADIVGLLFAPRWQGAAPLLQILCIAAAIRTVTDTHIHLLKAQGRYRDLLRFNLVATPLFLVAVPLGAWTGGVVGVAWAVVVHAVASGWLRYFFSVRPVGGTFWELGRILTPPTAAAAVPGLLSMAVSSAWFGWQAPSAARMCLGLTVTAACYLPLLRVLSSETSEQVWAVLEHLLRPLRRRLGGAEQGTAGAQEATRTPEESRRT